MTCTGNCLQGRACNCWRQDWALKRWLREHPESAADAIVLAGCLALALIVLAIEWVAL